MSIQSGVPGGQDLSPDLRLAVNVRRDFHRAIGLYSHGDHGGMVLRTIAVGVRAFRAVGWAIPTPVGPDRNEWDRLVESSMEVEPRCKEAATQCPTAVS